MSAEEEPVPVMDPPGEPGLEQPEEPAPESEQEPIEDVDHNQIPQEAEPQPEPEVEADYMKEGNDEVVNEAPPVEEHLPEEEKDDEPSEPKMELRIEMPHEEEPPKVGLKAPSFDETELEEMKEDPIDSKAAEDEEYVRQTPPTTKLENVLLDVLKRRDLHIGRLTGEITKLKAFISKRKQTYKRKRKEEGAPTRALSAYNIFVQDRFAKLAKQNEAALKSSDSDAQLKRVPPANLVAKTGNEWKDLPVEEKAKYEERAKADRKRYEEQMAQYQPPDKQSNRKRNKTGYNMFFSAHVLRLKQSELGVPSERGSVARLVGTAWKVSTLLMLIRFGTVVPQLYSCESQQLSAEEKQYYEREADKHNGMNPVEKDGDEDDEEEVKRQHAEHHGYIHPGHEMHMHGGMPPMHPMHQPPQHDPRHHAYPYPPHMYGQPAHGYYDYHQPSRHQHGRSQGYGQGYPQQPGHPYGHEQRM